MEQQEQAVQLPDGASAEIDDAGRVTIIQDTEHSITVKPEVMYWLVVWLVENHLGYLDFKAHEPLTCYECRGPVTITGRVYHLDEGAVTLCGPCTENVERTVLELQR